MLKCKGINYPKLDLKLKSAHVYVCQPTNKFISVSYYLHKCFEYLVYKTQYISFYFLLIFYVSYLIVLSYLSKRCMAFIIKK